MKRPGGRLLAVVSSFIFLIKASMAGPGNVQYVFITEIIRMYSTGIESLMATLVHELLEDF